MKSKEYAAEYCHRVRAGEEWNKVAADILIRLASEFTALMEQRDPHIVTGLTAIIREIDDRWQAICRRIQKESEKSTLPEPNFDAYRRLIRHKFSEIYEIMRRHDWKNDPPLEEMP